MKLIKAGNTVKLQLTIQDWLAIGKQAKWINPSLDKMSAKKKRKSRCWDGYKPVPGKKPFSDGSCKKK
jgi:hypothetical protein